MTPDRIRTIRVSLDLTQEELAREIGVTLSAVRSWERPAESPHHRTPGGAAVKILEGLEGKAREGGES